MSNLNKEKSFIELFLDDFEIQNWDLSLKAKEILEKSRNTFFSLYCLDFILCHIIIGNIRCKSLAGNNNINISHRQY